MISKTRFATIAMFSALVCVLGTQNRLHAAEIYGVGFLPGSATVNSQAFGISANGEFVYGQARVGSQTRSYMWSQSGGIVELPTFASGQLSAPTDMSADGSVVVGWIQTGSSQFAGVRWVNGGAPQDLGSFTDSITTRAHAVSDDGTIIVGESDGPTFSQAFRWTEATGMQDIGMLPGGTFGAVARGISGDGTVITGTSDGDGFRWTEAEGMSALGGLQSGSDGSIGDHVSLDGSVIGGRSLSALSAPNMEAFMWTQSGGIVGLGDLPGGDFRSTVTGITDDGSTIVGGARVDGAAPGSSEWTYYIWDEQNGMRELVPLLVSDYGLDLTGWTDLGISGISGDGTRFSGSGTHNGIREGFMIVVPEPSSIVLAGMALIGVLWMGRRNLSR